MPSMVSQAGGQSRLPVGQSTEGVSALHQRLFDPWLRDLVHLQDLVTRAAHGFFHSEGLTYLNLPITTGSISSPMGRGSDSRPLRIRMGEHETYLAHSMQFLLEYGCRLANQGCFYLAPSFRGEEVDDSHLQQFFHLEAEIPGSFATVRSLVERFLKHFVREVVSLRDDLPRLRDAPWLDAFLAATTIPLITYRDALGHIEQLEGSLENVAGLDVPRITRRGERQLLSWAGGPVWLVEPPSGLVPFYQTANEAGHAACGDLLLGTGEVCGAGERWPDGRSVRSALRHHGVAPVDYAWYVEMKDLTPLQTAGFGIGVERLLGWVLGEADIRKLELLPRRNDSSLFP